MVKHIYFTNRKEYYRRQKISAGLKRYYTERKFNIEASQEFEEETKQRVTRYSVTAMLVRGGDYGATLRAIIIDPQPVSRRALIISELKFELTERMQEEGIWGTIHKTAYEKAEIDLVEAEGQPRNKIFYEGFENVA